jgi:hypothetical protein
VVSSPSLLPADRWDPPIRVFFFPGPKFSRGVTGRVISSPSSIPPIPYVFDSPSLPIRSPPSLVPSFPFSPIREPPGCSDSSSASRCGRRTSTTIPVRPDCPDSPPLCHYLSPHRVHLPDLLSCFCVPQNAPAILAWTTPSIVRSSDEQSPHPQTTSSLQTSPPCSPRHSASPCKIAIPSLPPYRMHSSAPTTTPPQSLTPAASPICDRTQSRTSTTPARSPCPSAPRRPLHQHRGVSRTSPLTKPVAPPRRNPRSLVNPSPCPSQAVRSESYGRVRSLRRIGMVRSRPSDLLKILRPKSLIQPNRYQPIEFSHVSSPGSNRFQIVEKLQNSYLSNPRSKNYK